MKKYLMAGLMLVPLLAAPAQAAPADAWVEEYSSPEAQAAYRMSQGSQSSSGDLDDDDQTAVQQDDHRTVTIDDSDSNDTSEVSGSNILPIVGNDILSDVEVLDGGLLNNNSRNDSSTDTIVQSRSEDNDRNQTAILEDSFNKGGRNVPTVVIQQGGRGTQFRTVSSEGGLPRTGMPGHTFSLLAGALLSIVFGAFLNVWSSIRRTVFGSLVPTASGG